MRRTELDGSRESSRSGDSVGGPVNDGSVHGRARGVSQKRGAARSVGRFVFYPVARPLEQLQQAVDQIGSDWRALKQMRAERQRAIAALEPTSDDARQRFEQLYEYNEWSEPELRAQIKAFRNAKRSTWSVGLLLLIGCLISMFYVPWYMVLLMGPVGVCLVALMITNALKFGVQQSQLESRRLHSLRDYVSRQDFFKHVFYS